jgi:hypothetical protein
MLQHLNWRSLENRCKVAGLVMVYKIENELVAVTEKEI